MNKKQKEQEKALRELLVKTEFELDELVKKMYQNRLDKRDLINQLYSLTNPNLDETQTRTKRRRTRSSKRRITTYKVSRGGIRL